MKIMHICLAAFYIDNYSYQENILPKMHRKLGHEVRILASTETYVNGINLGYVESSEYINENGILVKRLPYARNSKSFLATKLRCYSGVFRAIEEFEPDLLFVHDIQFLSIREIVKYLKKHPQVKVVVDGHTDFLNSARNFLSKNILHKIIYKYCAKSILPYTTRFYGTLPARVDFFKTVYKIPSDKVSFLPMGIDDDIANKFNNPGSIDATRAEMGIGKDDFIIVTGGKIDLEKIQTLRLMKAVNSIKNSNVKLLLFGSVASELKEQFTSLCSDKVKYLGWAFGEESYKYFSVADIVVFPGKHSVYWEQAAGLGKPLVVHYWEGITHIDLGGNLQFIHDSTVEEIRAKLEGIIYDKKLYQSMKRVALEKGPETFSYLKIAQKSIDDLC